MRRFAGLVLPALCVLPSVSRAADVSALFIDPSVRAAGMGGVGTGVAWGACDAWANPAVRGLLRGVSVWSTSTTMSDGGRFHASEMILGHSGVGIGVAGRPVDVGGSGVETGHGPGDDLHSIGVGASLATLLGDRSTFGRTADLLVGYTWKSDAVTTAGADDALHSGVTHTRDRGLLLRVTPYDGAWSTGPVRTLRADVTFGGADLDYTRAPVVFADGTPSVPVARADRYGWAVRIAAGEMPARARIVRASLSPLVEGVVAWDHADWTVESLDDARTFTSSVVEHSGWEVTIARVVSLRGGTQRDHALGARWRTHGLTLAVPVGAWGGVRWDRATAPMPGGNDPTGTVRRSSISIWVDPRSILLERHTAR